MLRDERKIRSILTEDDFEITTTKIRGKTIHKKINSQYNNLKVIGVKKKILIMK